MTENISALDSTYVIDGVRQALTPRQMLAEELEFPFPNSGENPPAGIIDDESPEVGISQAPAECADIDGYLSAVLSQKRVFPLPFAVDYTRNLLSSTLIDSIWRQGHFGLGDLCVTAEWTWNDAGTGNMAAFYSSVRALAEHIDALGVKLRDYGLKEGECSLKVGTFVRRYAAVREELFPGQPFGTVSPHAGAASSPRTLVDCEKSWLIYIPFDTAPYNLASSLFAQATLRRTPSPSTVPDTDYFQDCYEVVREFVEDGIVLAGATVGEGGLMAAMSSMCGRQAGIVADLSDIMRSSGEHDEVKLLFSELPGVVIQVRDMDFDYVDAELTLQDVAFYPIGNPSKDCRGVCIRTSDKSGIQNILESLLRAQCGEGED